MNIFVLDENIERCAQYHCDQHVVKMILESVQILCTALNKKGMAAPYRSTHLKHPSVLWVEDSYDNFLWLAQLAQALNAEYRYRYDKTEDHKSIAVLNAILAPQFSYPACGLTEFPQAMPEQYKVKGDPVTAYRNFYRYDKIRFATWRKRQKPNWLVCD
ncbi:hypothetical protein VST7929_01512 [Vibrio stylophorae]|uniref:Uncharacterized protein n=1 Tax=Vibrio stylophorae TaxID=659351 RepID=A0ABM8ZTK6_9VIBR|nr:pyrimidine dimer DNA glycosylase/endonuclease V [Vibrio stylophorae]CAH0533641.1 hypothetical protein VST7929_01512 [Vibrio stylophorae]